MKQQPWLSPDESEEIIEILEETEETLRNTAQFGSMRKDLRTQLNNQATKLKDFRATIHGRIDPAVILGLESVARDHGSALWEEIQDALENHISQHNRRKA